MKLLARLPLRWMLTLPYIVLALVLAATIGALSYKAGREAVDALSDQLLTETVNRIAQAVDRHVAGSAAVLETAFPKGAAAPRSVAEDQAALRTRFWLATSVHRDPNNYAYYGDRDGHFFGLWRYSADDAELRLRTSDSGPRTIHRFTGIAGALRDPVAEQRIFDPRERPWFKAGQDSERPTWTSIYIDFKTTELVVTRARRVNAAGGQFQGVVACAAVLAIGLAVLNVVSRDLRALARAARNVGEGQLDTPLSVHRRDEIGDLARSFSAMQQRLLTDRLTGLSNREAVLRRIEDRIQQHRRRGDERPFVVMFADLNHFKRINDRHGHDAGDRVLQELALRLKDAVRTDDVVARYAGDEFLLMLDSVASRADARRLREQIEARLREPLHAMALLGEAAPGEWAAIGLAMYPEDGRDVDSLIQAADQDMYRRKPAA